MRTVPPDHSDQTDTSRKADNSDAVPSGFEAMFRANYHSLVRVFSPVSADAADAVQEAFIEALRHWDVVAGCGDPVAWVRRVAVNKLNDHGRRTRSQQRIVSRLQFARPAQREPRDRPDVTNAIARLPLRQGLAMTLFYLADLSVEDVARTMGISAGTVKSSLHAGRKGLRNILEVHDEDH